MNYVLLSDVAIKVKDEARIVLISVEVSINIYHPAIYVHFPFTNFCLVMC